MGDGGLKPTFASRLKRTPYAVIRSAHILWMMAVIPLAIASMKEPLQGMSGFIAGALFFSAMVWIMMFMFFDMMTYPTSTLAAVAASSTIFGNLYFAWRGSGGDWTYAAYMNFLSFLLAFAVAFVVIVAWSIPVGTRWLLKRLRESLAASGLARLRLLLSGVDGVPVALLLVVAGFYGGLAVSSVGFGIFFAKPFLERFLSIPSQFDRIALTVAFASQAGWNLVPFYRYSVIGPEATARPDSDPEKQPWFSISLTAMIFSVVSLLFISMWMNEPPPE